MCAFFSRCSYSKPSSAEDAPLTGKAFWRCNQNVFPGLDFQLRRGVQFDERSERSFKNLGHHYDPKSERVYSWHSQKRMTHNNLYLGVESAKTAEFFVQNSKDDIANVRRKRFSHEGYSKDGNFGLESTSVELLWRSDQNQVKNVRSMRCSHD